MKKISLFLYFLLIILTAFSADSSFVINGKFDKVKKGKIYLTIYSDDKNTTDSAIIKEGSFAFQGFCSDVKTGVLSYKKSGNNEESNYLVFYIEPANIIISGNGDSLKALSIKGSEINDDDKIFKERMKYITDWEDRNNKLYDEAEKNKNKEITDSLDEVDNDILKKKRKITAQFVNDYPHSMRSAMAVIQNYSYYAEADEVEPLYNLFDDNLKNSLKGIQIKKLIDVYKTVAVGMQAPEITENTIEGKPLSLSSLKGKYVLVDFWASWCGPCRRENPNVVKAYEEFKNKDFDIFSVSYDSKKDRWEKAIKADNLAWHHVSDLQGWKNATSDVYGIKAIPSNLLLDKNGKIIAKNIFGKNLTDKLSDIFNDK